MLRAGLLGLLATSLQPAAHGMRSRSPLRTRRTASPAPLLSVSMRPSGLVNSASSTQFFTSRLTEADLAVLDPGVLWEAACLDAASMGYNSTDAYLDRVQAAMHAFFHARELYDRSLVNAIRGALTSEGQFSMLLGGKSCGKSFMLNAIRRELSEDGWDILYIDARDTGADLASGIIQAVFKEVGMFDPFLEASKKVAPAIAKMVAKMTKGPDLSALLSTLLDEKPKPVDAMRSFMEAAAERGKFPCIIIDEANIVFATSSEQQIQDNAEVMNLFVRLTKQERRLTVLLASAEHGFPFTLQRSSGSSAFSLFDIQEVIHAGEFPPAEMRDLLVNRWDVGHRLADCLLASLGGQMLLVKAAIIKLAWRREAFTPLMVAPQGLTSAISKCFRVERTHPGISNTMRVLAVKGFAPIEELFDHNAQKMNELGIAGAVTYESTVVGLPLDVWKRPPSRWRWLPWRARIRTERYPAGLVPASQLARLLILERLQILR
ncbi:hypothetical protein AB1Y20_010678 [Prymnesium parvum]|uniref:AAA+ ATPase domain-containing protein n=1 Tax=Prymnesium parvum TaxID=97485 RepID=A0AB34IS30_PRYPA